MIFNNVIRKLREPRNLESRTRKARGFWHRLHRACTERRPEISICQTIAYFVGAIIAITIAIAWVEVITWVGDEEVKWFNRIFFNQ